MVSDKTPEGYESPGFVIVSVFVKTVGAPPIVNVYGMYPSRAEANKDKRKMLRETREHSTAAEMDGWELHVRTVHDIPQMNRLLDEQEDSRGES